MKSTDFTYLSEISWLNNILAYLICYLHNYIHKIYNLLNTFLTDLNNYKTHITSIRSHIVLQVLSIFKLHQICNHQDNLFEQMLFNNKTWLMDFQIMPTWVRLLHTRLIHGLESSRRYSRLLLALKIRSWHSQLFSW